MKTPKKDRLTYFADFYQKAKNAAADEHERMTRNMEQYNGSPLIDGSSEQATAVRNITYELIESQVSTTIPAPSVTSLAYSAKHDRCAKAVERLCSRLRDKLPFERLNDIDERYTYIYGGSVWLIEWDESEKTYLTSGDVRIRVISPLDFFPQPGVARVEDMEYLFIRFLATKEEIVRRYGITPKRSEETEIDGDVPHTGADEDGIATVTVCYYRDDDDRISRYVFSGDTELSDISDYYSRKVNRCKKCGKSESLCKCEHPSLTTDSEIGEKLIYDIPLSPNDDSENENRIPASIPVVNDYGECETELSDALMHDDAGNVILGADGLPVIGKQEIPKLKPTVLPYYRPRSMPVVVRQNITTDDRVFGQSDCDAIRPQQQQINKLESRIQDKLIHAGITPFMPEDARIAMNNTVFGNVIKLREGETANKYGTIDTTPDISRDLHQSERLYDHAKRILGISDSYQGMEDRTAKSGIAKQMQVAQASGRLESKRRMKNAAYADIDRIIFELYLAYADEPRPTTYIDEYGTRHNDAFNRYDFYDYDESTGDFYANDGYLFSTDLSGGVEQDRQTMWQTNLTNLTSGAFGAPQDPKTMMMYWRKQERAHYPYARENVEYFRQMIENEQAQAMAAQQAGIQAPAQAVQPILNTQGGI